MDHSKGRDGSESRVLRKVVEECRRVAECHALEISRRRQQSFFSKQWAELIQRNQETDQVDQSQAALKRNSAKDVARKREAGKGGQRQEVLRTIPL